MHKYIFLFQSNRLNEGFDQQLEVDLWKKMIQFISKGSYIENKIMSYLNSTLKVISSIGRYFQDILYV